MLRPTRPKATGYDGRFHDANDRPPAGDSDPSGPSAPCVPGASAPPVTLAVHPVSKETDRAPFSEQSPPKDRQQFADGLFRAFKYFLDFPRIKNWVNLLTFSGRYSIVPISLTFRIPTTKETNRDRIA